MSDLKLTPAEERVKAYLEEQSKTDTALATLYAPSKIKDCYKYITEQAYKAASSNSYFADDAEVWKWARDYFIEELPKNAEKIPVEVAAKTEPEDPAVDVTPIQETVKEVAETVEADAASDNVKHDEYGFEVFGEETEEPEEAAEEEPCCQVENVVEEDKPADEPIRYDESGNALLFDFM